MGPRGDAGRVLTRRPPIGPRAVRAAGALLAALWLALAPPAHAQAEAGERLLAADSLEAAEAAFRAILDADPVAARVGLARVALARGRPRDAEAHAARALERAPDDLAALLARALAYRDLARHETVLQRFHWRGAEEHFDRVLARDSSYADVLAEYALLRAYAERWADALDLAHAALRRHPDGVRPHRVLQRLYRQILHEGGEEAVAAATARPGPYPALYAAEAARRAARPADAARRLDALAADTSAAFPATLLHLARARAAFAAGEDAEGTAHYARAVASVDGPAASVALFEDAAFLFTPEEEAAYRSLAEAEALRAFWRAFWAQRDPMPARAVNARLAEHYRRLAEAEREYAFFGLRSFFNQPADAPSLDLPATFDLGEGFNDQGRVFLRHGEPDDRETALGADVATNMSWRYYGDPTLDVHFAFGTGGIGNNWRLTAVPPGFWTREAWGGVYALLARARSPLDRAAYTAELRDASRESTYRLLSTERHTWADDVVPLDIPHLVAAFRAPGGRTRVEVHYAVPTPALRDALPDGAARVGFEVGVALHDDAWREVAADRRTETVPLDDDGAGGSFHFEVPPDSYHVALHGRVPEAPRLLGGYRERLHAPDFSAPGLALSDLLPATAVEPAVRVAPGATFRTDAGVFVAFEVYGLRVVDGLTDAEVTYTLTPEGGRRRLFGLLGRDDRPVLTLRTSVRSGTADSVERTELDVSRVRDGAYTLTVTVTDRHAGTTARRARRIELVD